MCPNFTPSLHLWRQSDLIDRTSVGPPFKQQRIPPCKQTLVAALSLLLPSLLLRPIMKLRRISGGPECDFVWLRLANRKSSLEYYCSCKASALLWGHHVKMEWVPSSPRPTPWIQEATQKYGGGGNHHYPLRWSAMGLQASGGSRAPETTAGCQGMAHLRPRMIYDASKVCL